MSGSADLRLPDNLRDDVLRHLEDLRSGFTKRRWGGRMGFGERPAVVVIDLAKAWTDSELVIGSNLEGVVENTRTILDTARQAEIPVFFTVTGYAVDDPVCPWDLKRPGNRSVLDLNSEALQLHPRLERRTTEKLIVKKYKSCFRGTNLQDMLTGLEVDTLIVTGCSTSHCVHATCTDAVGSFHVIVPEEAVGDRCELFHRTSLLDIDLTLADVMPVSQVVVHLQRISRQQDALLDIS